MLFQKAEKYCDSVGISALLQSIGTVIIGFSGGADSSVLLSFLVYEKEKYPDLEIIAAHVNHMIRGAEADRDEEFCKSICSRFGIPLRVARIDVPKLSKESGKGLEETARDARYAFFDSLLSEHPKALIATAHNADDNLETVLFNLTRGSGTRGLCGIAPVRDKKLIRPLLSCSSDEIRSFANELSIPFVQDSTNSDTAYTRNTLRHRVVPLLKEINPRAADAARRLSNAARADCEFIESEAEKVLRQPVTRTVLRSLHPALFSRVVAMLYKNAKGCADDLSKKNISDCRQLIEKNEFGSISLPGGLCLVADRNEVFISGDKKCSSTETVAAQQLLPDNFLDFFDFRILCTENDDYVNTNEENIYNLSLHERLDCDKINGNLFVRQRKPGDTVRMRNMQKKLKKLLCDSDIPAHLRDRLPVITDGDGIALVPLIGMRDGLCADKNTKNHINIYIFEKERSQI